MNCLELINKIISFSKPGGMDLWLNVPGNTFGIGENGMHIPVEHCSEYRGIIDELFRYKKEISNTYAIKKFESLLIAEISPCVANSKIFKNEDVAKFFSTLSKNPIQKFDVARNIYGVDLKNKEKICELGAYKVYASDLFLATLKSRASGDLMMRDEEITSPYMIEVSVSARHYEKALELADIQFERLEKILRFMIGYHTNKYDAGVLNHHGWRGLKAYTCSDSGDVVFSLKNQGAFQKITLENSFFTLEKNGFHRLWEMTKKENLTELESRLLLSIEWIGQSFREASPASAFLYAAIAMEILFNYNQKALISSSILNQISESISFILGDDVTGRLNLEAEAKRLYGLRSAIAHAGRSDVSLVDLHSMFEIARTTVITIMTNPFFSEVNTVESLYKKLKILKYSCPTI